MPKPPHPYFHTFLPPHRFNSHFDTCGTLMESDDDQAFRQFLIGACHESDLCHKSDLLSDVSGRVSDYAELLLPTGLLQPGGAVEQLVLTDAISKEDYEQRAVLPFLLAADSSSSRFFQ